MQTAGFHLYSSNQIERLAEMLARNVLKHPLPDPFTKELIVIGGPGVETRLKEHILKSGNVDILCNVEFPFLHIFVNDIVYRVVTGDQETRRAGSHPFSRQIMLWRIFDKLRPAILSSNEVYAPLLRYIGEGVNSDLRRFQLAERIAELFDRYQVFRPEKLADWKAQRRQPDIAESELWQAELWHSLTHECNDLSYDELFRRFPERAMNVSLGAELNRVSIFGVTTMPPVYLDFFFALAKKIPVHFFFLNPCRDEYTYDLSERDLSRLKEKVGKKGIPDVIQHLEVGNPLLSSMGRSWREFLATLIDRGDGALETTAYVENRDDTLLHAVQNDILLRRTTRNNADESTEKRATLELSDNSIQIHICHNPLREMEVLHDNLLKLFHDRRDLEPRDIVVLAPDINKYAPYVDAVFYRKERNAAQYIPYTIMDRMLGRESAIVRAFLDLLGLARSRFKASEVMDILEVDAVRRAFNIGEADIDLIRKWVAESGIRWGINAQHREQLVQCRFEDASWEFGIQRMQLGYAMNSNASKDESPPSGDIIPYDGIESDRGELLNGFCSFVRALMETKDQLNENRTIPAWCDWLDQLLDRFFLSDNETYDQLVRIRTAVRNLRESAERIGCGETVGVRVIESCFGGALGAERADASPRGEVLFCSMQPMRSIPAKVMCLIGMDDDAYPRTENQLSFDLIASDPRACDRSHRHEDRHMFLAALLDARDVFYISYLGRSTRENTIQPPSVLASELRDYLVSSFRLPDKRKSPDGQELLCFETLHHLQAFNPEYFSQNAPQRLFSFSAANCEGARALLGEQTPRLLFDSSGEGTRRLPPPDANSDLKTIEMEQFVFFFRNPARFLLERRLKTRLEIKSGLVLDDTEVFDVAGLEKYQMEDNIFDAIVNRRSRQQCFRELRGRAALPLGTDGEKVFDTLFREAGEFAGRCLPTDSQTPTTLAAALARPSITLAIQDLSFTMKNGTVYNLTGELSLLDKGTQLLRRCGNLKATDLLNAWIHHLAFCGVASQQRNQPTTTVFLAKDKWLLLPELSREAALKHLQSLMNVYADGLCRPLPFIPDVSAAYMDCHEDPQKAIEAARSAWKGSEWEATSPSGNPYYRVCFGGDGPPERQDFPELAAMILQPMHDNMEVNKWPKE